MSMEYKRIDELTTVVTGGTPSTVVSEYWENGSIPWLQSGCCQNCDVNSTEKYITQLGLDNSSARMMPIDTVMIALTGATAGKIGYLNFEACGNQSITGIFPCEELNQRFLYYYLISLRPKILSDCVGGAQAHISQGYVKNIRVPVFSLEKQSKVAECLNKAQSIIDYRQQQIQSLDDLIKARFVEMFGDPNLAYPKENWLKIADIGSVVGGSTPKTDNEDFWDGEYRWLTPAEILSGSGYIYDSVRKITKAGAESCSLQEMPIGTVILSSRAPIGKVALAGNTFYCNQGFKNIICNDKINPVFLYSLLLFNTDYLNSLGRGATFKEISKSIVENIKIPVPKIELQNQFADFVTQIDKSKFIYLGGIYYDNRHFERNDSSCRWKRAG